MTHGGTAHRADGTSESVDVGKRDFFLGEV